MVKESSRKKSLGWMDGVLILVLSVLCLSMLYPFLNLLFISISDMADVMQSGGMLLYPKSINFSAY